MYALIFLAVRNGLKVQDFEFGSSPEAFKTAKGNI
jgi:hypothetical protein